MAVVLVLVVTVVALLLVKYVLKVLRDGKLLADIPSPPGFRFIGHILYFTEPLAILANLVSIINKYDGYVKMHMFGNYRILVADPDKAEIMLSTTKLLSKSIEYKYFDRWLGTGLLTSDPEKWKKTRKIITPTFHFQILEQFVDIFHFSSEIFVEKLRKEVNKDNVNIYPYVTLCTLDIICETAMGVQVNAQKESDSIYVKSVQKMSRIIRRRLFNIFKMPDILYYFTKDYRCELKALKVLHGYTNSVIEKRKEELDKNNFNITGLQNEEKRRMAFLDLLLCATIDGRPMTNEEIRQEVDTFMFEGHDTTASAIALAMYCLSQNLEVQNSVIEELHDIFGHDKDRHATYSELQNMKFLEMVIKEVLRLYPSVPYFSRKLLEDTELGGQIIPAGTPIIIFAYGLHRNRKIYPDPDKFDPKRFTPENQNKRNPYSFVPFSAGPRNCIGQKFAMLEMKAVLSTTLRHYELLPVEGFLPQLVPDLIIKSRNGVEMGLRERIF